MKTQARKKARRDLAVVALLVLGSLGLAMVQLQVFAYPSGYTGASVTGCECHGSNPSSGVTVTITGQPTEYTPATKYMLTVKVTGGPSPGGTNQGGFDLATSGGVLSVPSGSNLVQIIGGEATNTKSGNDVRQWDVDWTAPAQGSGTVRIDVAGMSVNGDGADSGDQWNRATYSVPEKNLADTVPPAITITAPTEGQQFPQGTAQVQASGTASDDVGIASVEVSTDGNNWQLATGTTGWTATVTVAPGNNTIHARAKDAANNMGAAIVHIKVLVPAPDTQLPNIIITAPTEGKIFPIGTDQVDITGTASDNVAVTLVEVSDDGVSWAPATGTTSWSAKLAVSSGNSTLQARARDAAANIRATQVNITVNVSSVDSVPPQVHITMPTAAQLLPANTTLFTVQGTASDDVALQQVDVSTDGTTWSMATGTAAWGAQIHVSTGPNTVHARAKDTSGNSALASVEFSVAPPPDTTKPSLTIASPAEGTAFPFGTKSVDVRGTASDEKGVKEVRFSANGTVFRKASGNTSWSFTLDVVPGNNHVTIEAEDFSNNINTGTLNLTVLEDTYAPLLLISSHSNGATLLPGTKSIVLAGMASDNGTVQKVEVSTDNTTWLPAKGTTSWNATMKLSSGTNTLYVKATDAKGNTAYAKVEVVVPVTKQNLWPLHVVILVIAVTVALGIWVMGWRIRRDKTKRTPKQRALRRKLHILIGPVFTTILIVGFVQALINRYIIRGIVMTSIHGYLSVIAVILYTMGGVLGVYMAMRRPTDALRKAHLILVTGGTLDIIITVVLGIQMMLQLRLL